MSSCKYERIFCAHDGAGFIKFQERMGCTFMCAL